MKSQSNMPPRHLTLGILCGRLSNLGRSSRAQDGRSLRQCLTSKCFSPLALAKELGKSNRDGIHRSVMVSRRGRLQGLSGRDARRSQWKKFSLRRAVRLDKRFGRASNRLQ